MTRRPRRAVSCLAVALVLLLGAGCSIGGPMNEDELRNRPLDEQRAELARRPTTTEIRAVYERMQADIRARLAERLGLEPWVSDQGASRSFCGDFAVESNGESGSLDMWAYERNVPDPQWPELTRIVEQVAVGYGFQPLERVNDNPGNQATTTTDQYGATFRIGNGPAAMTLGIYTGCHPAG